MYHSAATNARTAHRHPASAQLCHPRPFRVTSALSAWLDACDFEKTLWAICTCCRGGNSRSERTSCICGGTGGTGGRAMCETLPPPQSNTPNPGRPHKRQKPNAAAASPLGPAPSPAPVPPLISLPIQTDTANFSVAPAPASSESPLPSPLDYFSPTANLSRPPSHSKSALTTGTANSSPRPRSPAESARSAPTTSTGTQPTHVSPRTLRIQLSYTTPRVHLGTPYHPGKAGKAKVSPPPPHVADIMHAFEYSRQGFACIPASLQRLLTHPSNSRPAYTTVWPPHMFVSAAVDAGHTAPSSEITPEDKQLLFHVRHVLRLALQCFQENGDEHQWYDVVRPILEGPSPPPNPAADTLMDLEEELEEIESREAGPPVIVGAVYAKPCILLPAASIMKAQTLTNKNTCRQTKLITQSLLPRCPGDYNQNIATAKVDYWLQLNLEHPSFVLSPSPLNRLFGPGTSIHTVSALNDPQAVASPTFLPVVVKSAFGNPGEAGYQAALASVATLELWRSICSRNQPISLDMIPPVPALVVVGHVWSLYWTFWVPGGVGRESEGSNSEWEVVQLGPLAAGGTDTLQGVFMLCGLVRKLKAWGVSVVENTEEAQGVLHGERPGYWGMVRRLVLDADGGAGEGVGGDRTV